MNNIKSTRFIPREVESDPSRKFEERVARVTPSIIAFGYGTNLDGSPNVIGTGFCVKILEEKKAGLFVTCSHVKNEMNKIRGLSSLEKEGLIDKKRRIALLENGTYIWT